MLEVVELNSIEQVGRYRLLWSELLGKTRSATFFQSLDWLEAYWHREGDGQRLRVLIVSLGSRPLGVVPLVVREEQSSLGAIRVLTYPLNDQGFTYGPIGPNPAATLVAAVRHIRDTRKDWDVFDLHHIDRFGTEKGRTRNAFRSAEMGIHVRDWRNLAIVEFGSDFEAGVGTKTLEKLKESERLLRSMGQVCHVRVRPGGAVLGESDRHWSVFNQIDLLGASTSESGQASPIAAIHKDLHGRAVDAGQVDMNLLMLNGKPIAGAYGYCCEGRIELLSLCEAKSWGGSAATVLMGRMLQDGIVREDESYALTGLARGLRRDWTTSTRPTQRCTHFRLLSPRAQLLRLQLSARATLGWDRLGRPRVLRELAVPQPVATAAATQDRAEGASVAESKQADASARPTFRVVG